uniref:MGS-like domain-containing protein n=1 Tax=Chrysotila carterae TaxID=13221 RepID=A0A7S4AZR5_CHRCT|mmetsp:Transcript_56782/g.123475  ORF Transcript_56782/g.123475 Transcript_56782/m.123475 type:complete len:587 (+) Transcript_56782:64-1824(+)
MRALLSVSDKTGLVDFAQGLSQHGVTLLSTGGTAKAIREAGIPVTDVSEYTESPEIMDGRVKTLHPRVHGGILMRGTEADQQQLLAIGGQPIDLVVVNLYPFSATVAKGAPFADCIENIDIGGPTMVRAAAKNHARVTVIVQPSDYAAVLASMPGGPDDAMRAQLALKAFSHTATYDTAIAEWMQGELCTGRTAVQTLKYGCNPQQKPASIRGLLSPSGPQPLPFAVLSGTPGYINLLDALNAWQLVRELGQATGLPAAASFKHVSPAGAAVYAPIDDDLLSVYEATGKELSKVAVAYLRSRQADPLCSFGDFVAVSEVVDASTAALLKIEVSDGIIAPGYEPAALEILRAKKGGKYIVLEADVAFEPPEEELRTVFGASFRQRRALEPVDGKTLENVVTGKKELSAEAKRDLLVAQIAIKYTQSNSVGYAKDGQMVGVGAGQQSRVDCVKLAGRKVDTWYLRQHPKVRALQFKAGVKRQERINARVRYIEGDMPPTEFSQWKEQFEAVPEPLSADEKRDFLATLTDVSLASDAFFPFRDSLDVASSRGVKFVVAAGGSVADEEVIGAANEYGMTMAFSGLRLFHH